MKLEIKHTGIFDKNYEALENDNIRFILNQGGSRSSKTYSICQLLILTALLKPKTSISIVRKSFPALRGSVMRDMIDLLKELNLYSERQHNKTDNRFMFDNESSIEFFSVDDSQKLRGRKRDILWANEGNELDYEDFLQLNLRTVQKLIFDFNPSDNDSYLYQLLERDNSILIKSTYKDNPFLAIDQVKEIEELINTDENFYKIYALGEKPIPTTRIYSHFKLVDEIPNDNWDIWYGLDFGHTHPSALIKVYNRENVYYVEELLYKSFLTSGDLVNLINTLSVDKNHLIYADWARPEIIEDLRRAGYNMKEATKEVKAGIDSVKSSQINILKTSTNIWNEFRKYSWKTRGNEILEEPVKLYDDCLDALRYAIHSAKDKVDWNNINFYF